MKQNKRGINTLNRDDGDTAGWSQIVWINDTLKFNVNPSS